MKPLGSKRKEVHHGFLPELLRRREGAPPSYPLAKTKQPKAIGLESSVGESGNGSHCRRIRVVSGGMNPNDVIREG